ncbi:pentatricopeptide repeat-containing protein At4g18975, chloroplastic isoform X2 [Hevea brasiliensis]|uniref:pentatricopeptide repeat-containing protein At4g18975, chloroplastic isoform X2 n=1 Tax=Hevea brasiliensis TaxID=3981 RepID=UPI0025D8C311|nr:pentatricopeptide repeat-containing protein At4g18975, chloroplastic isoform X2 [Hevea brasiliensis]
MALQSPLLFPVPQHLFHSSSTAMSTANASSTKAASSFLAFANNNSHSLLFVDFVGLYSKSNRDRRRIGIRVSSSPSIARTSLYRFVIGNSCSFRATLGTELVPQPDLKPKVTRLPHAKCSHKQGGQSKPNFRADKSRKTVKKDGNRGHNLWKKRDPARSGEKALNLVRIVSELPNEKEAVYGALDKWTAWETEFPLLAVAKALRILRKRSQWLRVIQVAKWMLSKGQGTTMGTYDTLLLAFDMDNRIDEAESLWNMILHTHTRSISKRLFSRMISLYDHHNMPDEIIEVFADMEELGVRPDEDTVRRLTHAFKILGQEDKQMMVVKKYMRRWKYIHFNGERVRVRREI